MRYLKPTIVLLVWSAFFSSAQAQPAPSHGGRAALWTSAGAGAGFGIGLWAGLTTFDDAINSDRKVWTSAIVGAAAGGTLAYLLTHARRRPWRSRVTTPPLSDGDVRALAASMHLRR